MSSKNKTSSEILKKRGRRKTKGLFLRIIRLLIGFFLVSSLMGIILIGGVYLYITRDLPKIESLKDYRPPVVTSIYSDDGRKIGEFYKEHRIVIPLSDMPQMLLDAFVAAEDARYYKHEGVDFLSIIRAFIKNIEAGTIVQGGSTITQQVTKSFFLTPEKSYQRKIKEAILAWRIDKSFTKNEILFLYLNQIYLGHGSYGVESAAENYFGKSAKNLTLSECAILAGLPQAPSSYSPFRYPERARKRQIYVLNRMVAENYISNMQATEALNQSLDIKTRKNWYIDEVPYYTEYVRQYVENKYGSDALYKGGLQVYTAVNIEMQKAAREEIHKGLRALDKRQGFRGSIKHLEKENIESYSQKLQGELSTKPLDKERIIDGVVINVDDASKEVTVRVGNERGIISFENMKWARKPDPTLAYYEDQIYTPSQALSVGDVIDVRVIEKNEKKSLWQLALEQKPEVQAALLCLESDTGQVKVMVGGRDFRDSQFNRAIQSRRQPGSAFKPIIYAAALDKGYTPATVILDTAVVYEDKNHLVWKPKNYNKKFYGPTRFREAITHSRNLVTIKILKDIGIEYVIDYARKLGITSHLNKDLSLALGSSGVSLLEIVNAYSVFANMGYRIEPVFVKKIIDRDGNDLEKADREREKVIEKSTAYIITNLLEGVVKEGTGRRVKALNRPVAGKTGTTNDLNDAWFAGYTPRYITGTWVGFDKEAKLGKGETGSRAASPIWLEFMKRILKEKPVRVFPVPEGVVFAKIDPETGLLPNPENQNTIFECFKEGTAPTEHTKKQNFVDSTEDFFKSGM